MSQSLVSVPGNSLPEIWVALDDPAARLRLDQVAAALLHVAHAVAPGSVSSPPPTCVAIVCDLQPADASLTWLEEVRRNRQGIPIVLYLAVRTGADSALTRAVAIGVDGVIFQRGKADERDRVRGVLQRVLDQQMVANFLDRLAATVPRSAIGFRVLKHFGIKMAVGLDVADHVETVAAALGAHPRSLQRMLRADGWPGPKELLDWMTLFLVALANTLPADKAIRRRIQRSARRLLGLAGLEEPPDTGRLTEAFAERLRRLGCEGSAASVTSR